MSLHQLVIQNLAVLEQAPAVAEQADDKIMRAVWDRVAEWVSSRPEWWVDAEYDDSYWKFGPKDWPLDTASDEYKAWYRLGSTSESDTDYNYYVSALTGAVSPIEFGIWFEADALWLTHLTGRGAKPQAAWQKFLASQLGERLRLASGGFRMIRAGLFVPFRLAADDLANAYPDALGDALSPIDDVLGKLEEAHSDIDSILNAAATQFPRR